MDGFLEDHFQRLVVRYGVERFPVQVVVESLYSMDNCQAFSFHVTVVRLRLGEVCRSGSTLLQDLFIEATSLDHST